MIYNKERCGRRGKKKRQAIVRAEINEEKEERCEKLCLGLCKNLAIDINDYFDLNEKWPWQKAYQNILDRVLTNKNGVTYLGAVLRLKI